MTILPLGDAAFVAHLSGEVDAEMAARVRALANSIARLAPVGMHDVVPAFASVGAFFDPLRVPTPELMREIFVQADAAAESSTGAEDPRQVEIPVVYGGAQGPDLAAVAAHTGFSPDEIVARHAAGDYLVHAIGFAPGFPYLGGLDPRLATPRRPTPRTVVPAGSVGIGSAQTGVYPFASPGGWNLIGRTPLALFDPRREPAALLRAGDRVRFRAIAEHDNQFQFSGSPARESRDESAPDTGIEILRAGQFSTVQDLGRPGHRAAGVPIGGAADPFALRIANLIAGNEEGAAALECTLTGPTLRFARDAVVAWGGAETAALPSWRPVAVRAGETLEIGALRKGCRGYLAIGGGIATESILGSRSTLARAGLGRVLRDGDALPLGPARASAAARWGIDERMLPHYSAPATVRVVAGQHAADFKAWAADELSVSAQSDRMGVRLAGAVPRRGPARELVSSPVAPGTIQVPPDGQPIMLLADAQTIGGYPQLAHVITVDLPLVAQLRPGDRVRLAEVPLDEARRLLAARERSVGLLREGLAQKFR